MNTVWRKGVSSKQFMHWSRDFLNAIRAPTWGLLWTRRMRRHIGVAGQINTWQQCPSSPLGATKSDNPTFKETAIILLWFVCLQILFLKIKWTSWEWRWTSLELWPASGSCWPSAWSSYWSPSCWPTSTGKPKSIRNLHPWWSSSEQDWT